GILLIAGGSMSCEKDFSVDLSNRGFVRMNKQQVALNIGEKYIIKAVTDTIKTHSKDLVWSVLDSKVASVDAAEGNTAIITGLSEGTRSEEHTSELQSRENLVCRLQLEKKK